MTSSIISLISLMHPIITAQLIDILLSVNYDNKKGA